MLSFVLPWNSGTTRATDLRTKVILNGRKDVAEWDRSLGERSPLQLVAQVYISLLSGLFLATSDHGAIRV